MRLLAELRDELSTQRENDEHGYAHLQWTTRTWRQRRRNYTFGFTLYSCNKYNTLPTVGLLTSLNRIHNCCFWMSKTLLQYYVFLYHLVCVIVCVSFLFMLHSCVLNWWWWWWLHFTGVCRIFTARRWASAVLAVGMWLSVSVTCRSSMSKRMNEPISFYRATLC